MIQNNISICVTAEGTFLKCPAKLAVGSKNGSMMLCGELQWGGKKISDTLKVVNNNLPGEISDHVDSLLPGCLPGVLAVTYEKDSLMIMAEDSGVCFTLARKSGQTALCFCFQMADCQPGSSTSALVNALGKAAGFFGIKEFLFYAQTGDKWLLPALKPGNREFTSVPAQIKKCCFLTYAHIVLDGNSTWETGIRTLFGLRETSLFVGAGKNTFLCMVTVPAFKTSFLESKDMYIWMEISNNPQLVLKGSFLFSFIPEVTFTVDCGVGRNAFRIEALAHVEKPVKLFGPFSLGDSCLMIQVGAGLEFGLYSSLYIRNIQLFGAILLRANGPAVVPELLSAAVSDLSIPLLLENLTGEHIPGIEVFNFIKILGLPFQNMKPFSAEHIRNKDIGAVVERFNSQVTNESLRLDANEVQLTPFGNGTDLADLKRMRHYYISPSGNLQLAAQFYFSTVNTKLGNYTVQRGFFICGVLEIFKKRFEVLFSFRESEGLLAYAKIPSINLGFLKIGPSKFSKNSGDTLPLAKDSVLAQFINPAQQGMVFFLSAGKKEVSFYFDGGINILSLFEADARISFCKGLISVDLRVVWLSILQISLHLSVDYGNFTSEHFSFCLIIDTAPLTKKLNAVTEKIDAAVTRVRNKIGNAKREVDRAQAHVNELYGQISYFDRKISECKNAIKNASWWKKVFVAIAKGIEIGAYEVAKAGIYVAIGVATAALQVAKGILELSGKIGEGVLKAVNAVIKGAMSLFYINYIQLEAAANANSSYFLAKIEFVALGKNYKFEKQIGKKALTTSPSNALSGAINEKLEPDLAHIEDGAFKSNWRKYRHETYTVEQHCRRLAGAKEHLNASISLMESMQNTYIDEFHIPMEEFDEMNVSLIDSLDHVENVLNTGAQAGNVAELGNSMGGLKRSVAAQEKKGVFRDEELAQTKKLIADYDEARMFYDKVLSGIRDVKKQKQSMQAHCTSVKEKTVQAGESVMKGTDGDIGKVLLQVEDQMYQAFPVDRSGKDFINLSREPCIRESFSQAQEQLGIEPSETVRQMRNRSRKGSYQSRL